MVNEQPLQVLVDTGAHKSFISNETFQRLRPQLVHNQIQNHWLADGITPFITNGKVNLSVKIGPKETMVVASVAKTLSCFCILGTDWLLANNVSILTHESRIAMFDKKGNEIASQEIEMG
jgi:predicted aspartyl protease